jgi:DEAD/DEAH box helicase domain-containing protein
MPTLNALKAVENVKKRLVDFVLEDHFVKEPTLRDACQAIWGGSPEKGGLVSDLWAEGTFPNKTSGTSLAKRAADGTFSAKLCKLIDKNNGFGKNWIPRSIQSESMDAALDGYEATEKPSIVITAGTGAGKTEAFLLPMLNELFTNQPKKGEGISSIILYPMNALVKDQVDRLHGWLKDQSDVRLFSFTGATPETTGPQHFRDGSRLSSREEARGKGLIGDNGHFTRAKDGGRVSAYRPPEILVTNYSMLEYMLARPQDQVFFGKNLRTIVLDEAHLYRGNLAAEIALLLRRVYLKCGVRPEDVLQFATSATIGRGGEEGDRQLKEFAAKLFTKNVEQIKLIKGEVEKNVGFSAEADPFPLKPADLAEAAIPQEETLTVGENQNFRATQKWDEWSTYLEAVFGKKLLADGVENVGKEYIGKLLHWLLPRSAKFQDLYAKLFNDGETSRIRLETLAEELFPGEELSIACEACRRLLEFGALARAEADALPLIPNRIHALFRAPDGLSFCFDPCGGCEKTRIPDEGFFSGEWFLAGVEDASGHLFEVPQHMMWKQDGEDQKGKAEADTDADFGDNDNGAEFGDRIRYFKLGDGGFFLRRSDGELGGESQEGSVELVEHTTCPVSGVNLAGPARFFSSPSRLTLSIIVESLLAEMPPFPDDVASTLPARGRRLIAFSDSRSEASRLGPKLQEQHETQIVRAAIARSLEGAATEIANRLNGEITQFNTMLSLAPDLSMKGFIEQQVADKQKELDVLVSGISLDVFANRLKERPEISQLINDANNAREKHQPEDWPQQWEANKQAIKQDASINRLLARELCRRPSWPGLTTETTGLIEVVYPGIEDLGIPDAVGGIGNEQGRAELQNHWSNLLIFLCDEIRNKGCITSGDGQFDKEIYCGKWLAYSEAGYSEVNLCPAQGMERTRVGKFMMGLVLATGIEADWQTAERILKVAFDQLLYASADQNYPWLKRFENAGGQGNTFQIDFRGLRFRTPLTLFCCEKTGQIWPRTIGSIVPSMADVSMKSVTATELDADPFVGRRRNEWRTDRVFELALWAEEHSAQLQVTENERIQNLFKVGIRNVLSSTTTLELGIDIGGLSGVVMGNMPPGKASYLQRAGRAGRRADGSSLVAGFARSTPYERKAFLSFGEYLDKPLPPPTVFLDREKIVRRHLHMYLLGEFMNSNLPDDKNAGAMNAFNNMAEFTGRRLPEYWGKTQDARNGWVIPEGLPDQSLASNFAVYLGEIKNTGPTEPHQRICREITDFEDNWNNIIDCAIADFEKVTNNWCESFDALGQVWNAAGNNEQDLRLCSMLHREGNSMDSAVIEEMGNGLFIPRYGFPIGVKSLKVLPPKTKEGEPKSKDDGRYKLERDAVMAMREYSPGSQIVVGGKRITSRGILKHWTGENVNADGNVMLSRGHYQLGGGNFRFHEGYLGYEEGQKYKQAIFPKHGFTTARSEQPERGGKLEKVGQTIIGTTVFNGNGQGRVVQLTQLLSGQFVDCGEIYVINEGKECNGFAICTKCGFAKAEDSAEKGAESLPKKFKQHTSIFRDSGTCWNQNQVLPVLRHQMIASKQITDLILLDFSHLIPAAEKNTAITLSQALRLAGAEMLHLDPREIRTLNPIPYGPASGYALVIYDSLAGGSGHVEELSKMAAAWFYATIRLLTVDGDVSDEWKVREATRRLLTSEIRDFDADFRFKPREALRVLSEVMNGSADIWNFQRISSGETLPNPFEYFLPNGVQKTMILHDNQGPPRNGQFCIVRSENGGMDYGKWMYSPRGNQVMMFRLIGSISMDTQTKTAAGELPEVIAVEAI